MCLLYHPLHVICCKWLCQHLTQLAIEIQPTGKQQTAFLGSSEIHGETIIKERQAQLLIKIAFSFKCLLTMIIVAICAVMIAYTPPDAPARYTFGSETDVPKDPATTPAK